MDNTLLQSPDPVVNAPNPETKKDAFTTYFDDQQEETMSFSVAKIHLKRIIDDWKTERDETEERRKTRDIDVDVQALRNEGKLDEDETLIPDRVIDTNIQREQPPYINYLKNSRRLAIFNCLSNPDLDAQKLELEFTRGMTYPSWETPHYKCLDGAQTHGWDAIEVVYDSSKPLNVALEQVGHDRLLFPRTCLDIQDAAQLIRVYDVTLIQLKKFVENNGFDREQVGQIITHRDNKQTENETVRIYKRSNRFNGQIYVSWFSIEMGCDDWLKKPIPLFLGIKHQETKQVPVNVPMPDPATGQITQQQTMQPQTVWVDTPVTDYPYYVLPYRETEKPKVVDHKGRCFLDENKQEAQTAILSSFVNGLYRATNIYACMKTEDGNGASLQELENVSLGGNRILNKPVEFFHTDYPDPMVLKALEYFDTANSAETNQVNFAVNNRQDSRKTAKEITSSEQQQSMLNSVQLTLFSTHIRAIYNLVWLIVQSQAMQNKIKFLQIKIQQPQLNPVLGTPVPDPTTGQPITQDKWVNDTQTISQIFDIRAAGDVDVIQRQEKVNQMKLDWPIISQTVLKDEFLAELIRMEYPDTGEKWATILIIQGGQMKQMQGLLSGLANMLQGAIKDDPKMMHNLPPQQQNAMMQMIQQAQQLSGAEPTKPNAQPS